ncbi:MAG: RpiB/LacA/LacB family sugar-phosphate isomerase [Spirochaetia bacterium]|jgi:ribose 5-phosphate isomerase B|nr:RpiB/LacA/LacB family sugar-phosphate isomerase [Spirochaetia bacterium]
MATKKWKVAVGCDPNASELKETIKELLKAEGHSFEDFGSDDPIYPNVAFTVGEAVASGKFDRGILVCGTGIGMSIAANKVPGVYAALLADPYSAERAIKSNNTNVATLGQQTMGPYVAKALIKIWLDAEWEPGTRSEPKVQAIVDYAAKQGK